MDEMRNNSMDLENLSAGHVNYVPTLLERIWGRLPKVLIYASFAVFSIIYVCTVTVSLPILFGIGLVIGTVFALRAAAEFWRIFKNKSDDYVNKEADRENPEGKSSITIEKQRLLDFIALLIFGLSLVALGITLVASPAFLGIFLQTPIIFKIVLIALGSLFVFKSMSYFESKLSRTRLGCVAKNLPDTLLYVAGLSLGIFSLVITGGLSTIPILFTTVFACLTASSICHMFPNKQIARKLSRNLEIASLMVVSLGLFFAGILASPVIAASLGISVLFIKTALLITGFLFTLSALAKAWVGAKLEDMDNCDWHLATDFNARDSSFSDDYVEDAPPGVEIRRERNFIGF